MYHSQILLLFPSSSLFFFNTTAPTEIYTLSLHDALPIYPRLRRSYWTVRAHPVRIRSAPPTRSEEHTSELQSRFDLVCRLLLEKKKKKTNTTHTQKKQIQTKNTNQIIQTLNSNYINTTHI